LAKAQVLQVRHDHNPWGKCEGEFIVSEEGIEYRTEKEDHNRQWEWEEIQSFDRKSPIEFSIVTYEDQKWTLGSDRRFNFSLLPEQDSLSGPTFRLINERLEKPVVDRVAQGIEAEYQVPVKHLHTFGGCEGTLYFGEEWIVYETDHKKDARTWHRAREVESVWSLNRYQLEVHVFEEDRRNFDKTRRFRFQLKESLNQEYYDKLRREFLVER
jgi:hypothetical protein